MKLVLLKNSDLLVLIHYTNIDEELLVKVRFEEIYGFSDYFPHIFL